MKNMKKIFALLIAMAMMFGMSTNVLAASITVNQDSTYAGTDNQPGRTFTYKQIFHATLSGSNTSTGGGYDADGTPGTVSASLTKGYSYYLNSSETTQIGALGTWVAATESTAAHWEKASGNLWFKLTPSADGTQYIVEWDAANTDTDTAQAAAKWLSANYTPLASNNLTWDSTGKKWTATDLEDGYYLLSSDTGDNLIAATGDITVNEKNSYPPVEKTQADEDNNVQTDQDKNVAVGDILDYEVKVTVPASAKVGETIAVYDSPSTGLSYDSSSMKITVNGTEVTPAEGADVAPAAAQTGEAWRYTINVNANNKGKDVIFKFKMTVTAAALTDPDKENPAGVVYNNYNSKPDKVKFKTYYTGIKKIDGDTEQPLEGVTFALTENDVAFNVTKSGDYYIPGGTSNIVETDANGLIIIRGLDDDKEYVLTEKTTLDGYNLLDAPKTLELVEDTYTASAVPTTEFDQVVNNKGAVLPSTGGMGTTLFYIFGALLVLGGSIFLISRRRMVK